MLVTFALYYILPLSSLPSHAVYAALPVSSFLCGLPPLLHPALFKYPHVFRPERMDANEQASPLGRLPSQSCDWCVVNEKKLHDNQPEKNGEPARIINVCMSRAGNRGQLALFSTAPAGILLGEAPRRAGHGANRQLSAAVAILGTLLNAPSVSGNCATSSSLRGSARGQQLQIGVGGDSALVPSQAE